MMATPQMPQQNLAMYNPTSIPDQERQLLPMEGIQRLELLQECYIYETKGGGCSDMIPCQSFSQELQVKVDAQAQNNLFKIQFDKIGCLQQVVNGKILSLNYQNQGFIQEQELFQIGRERKNCILKGICCPLVPITCCIFCMSNSKGTIYYPNGEQISQSTFAELCSYTHTVEVKNQSIFTLEKPIYQFNGMVKERAYNILKNGNQTDIQIKICQQISRTSSSNNGSVRYQLAGKKIYFGQGNLTLQEKISLIFIASQLVI